jgi:integrase
MNAMNLYKKKNRAGGHLPCWYCFFRVPGPDGEAKQIHRSTGKTTKKEAMIAARLLEDAALKEAGAGEAKSAAILSKLTEAGELAMRGRLNPGQARRILGEIMEISEDENLVDFTLRQWVDEWMKEKEATTKKATAAFYKSTTKAFIEFLGDKADSALESITTKDIRSFRDNAKKKGNKGKTCNHKLKALRSLFADAVRADLLLRNPAVSIKPQPEIDSVEREPFTLDQIQALVACADTEWKGMTLLGALAGLRLQDAACLVSDNVDMERGVLHFIPMKTDRKKTVVEIPMHRDLSQYFEDNPPPPFKKTPIFPSLAGKSPGGREGLSWQFGNLMDEVGIDRQTDKVKAHKRARATPKLSFHSLRHTFTSLLAKADVPQEVRMKMTGHMESTTHQKYTHQEMSTLREGVGRLPSIG